MNPEWSTIVQDQLLASGLVSGVCLLSGGCGHCSFTDGNLSPPDLQDWAVFTGLFNNIHDVITSLTVVIDGNKVKFTVFRRTQCSVYGISEGCVNGLIVCSVSSSGGLIITTCPGSPAVMNKAIPLVETFASTLRQ